MALALLDRASDAFANLLEGAAASFDLDQPPAGVEDIPKGLYDVGEIVRQKTLEWLGTAPNLVTPANLALLLEELDDLTTQVEAHVAEHGPQTVVTRAGTLSLLAPVGGGGIAWWLIEDKVRREHERALEAVLRDLKRFRIRLDRYKADVAAVADPSDRAAVLWEVTNPLFFGWFGGETGVEVELPPGGVPEGFNTADRHPPDLAEPFRIANALGVWLEWRQRTPALLVEDTKDEAKRVADAVVSTVPVPPGLPVPPSPPANPWSYVLAGAAGLAVGGVGMALLWSRSKR